MRSSVSDVRDGEKGEDGPGQDGSRRMSGDITSAFRRIFYQ